MPQALGNDLLGAAVLSAVAGYVDTAGFLALYGLLTAHVTGDLVTAGVLVAEDLQTGAATRLSMIPIFMLSVAATALFARRYKRDGREPLAALLGLMTAALALFGITGVALQPWAGAPDDWAVALIGGTGVVAMAVQNTLMRDALSTFCPTTIMTGNLTQVTIDLVEILLPSPDQSATVRAEHRAIATERLRRFGYPLLGFTLGAGFGALLTHALGLMSIALPTAVVGWLTFVAWRVGRKSHGASTRSAARAKSSLAAVPSFPARNARQPGEAVAESDWGSHDERTVGTGRRVSGTRIAAMQVPNVAHPDADASGTYRAACAINSEAPTSKRTPHDRRRARS